jgi:hypothetical protein
MPNNTLTLNAGSSSSIVLALTPGNGAPEQHQLAISAPAAVGQCTVEKFGVSYTSPANAEGTDSCEITVTDANGDTSTGKLNIILISIPQAVNADLNGDGVVNFADLGLLRSHFGSNNPLADLNGDGAVNFADLALFKLLFGKPAETEPLFTVANKQLTLAEEIGNETVSVEWKQATGLNTNNLNLKILLVLNGNHGQFQLNGNQISYTPTLFARSPQDTGLLRLIDPTGRFLDIALKVNNINAEPDIPHVYVDMTTSDLGLLFSRSVSSDVPLPGTLRYRPDEAGKPVNLRFRGSSSRSEPKKGFNIRFPDSEEFLDGGDRFQGMSMWSDPSFLRDRISYWLFNQYGMPSSRTKYYLFFLNDIFEGLYLNVERVDENFLEARGMNPNGTLVRDEFRSNLSKECVKSTTSFGPNQLSSLPREEAIACLSENFDSGNANWDEVLDLILWVESSSPGEIFAQELAERVDIDAMIKFLGTQMLVGDMDALWGSDYWWYKDHEQTNAKWLFIPWDKNLTFGSHWHWPAPDGTGLGSGNLFFPVEYSWTSGIGQNRLFLNFINTPSLRQALGQWLLQQIDSDTWLSELDAEIERSLEQTIPYSAANGIFPAEFARNRENRLDIYGTYEELVEQVTEYRDLRRNHLRVLVNGMSGQRHMVNKNSANHSSRRRNTMAG